MSNYCKSALRKRNAKRKIQFAHEGFTSLSLENYSDEDDSIEFILNPKAPEDPIAAMNHLLGLLSKKDALILKMKNFYGKSSIEKAVCCCCFSDGTKFIAHGSRLIFLGRKLKSMK